MANPLRIPMTNVLLAWRIPGWQSRLFMAGAWLVAAACGCGEPAAPPAGPAARSVGAAPEAAGPPAVPGAAGIVTKRMETEPLGEGGRWNRVPEFLEGAELHKWPLERTPGRDFGCTITVGGVMVVAAARIARAPGQPAATADSDEVKGWEAIGRIRRNAGAAGDEMVLFRRQFSPDEKFEFSTTAWSNPYVVVLKEKHVAPVLARKPALTQPLDFAHLVPPARPPGLSASSPRNVVMLNTHELASNVQGPGILRRELARQAFLLAAREELGLATRDKSLREAFPQEAEPAHLPFDIIITIPQGEPARVTVFQQRGSEYEFLWGKALHLAADGTLEDLVAQCEALSREDFVALLQRAGLERAVGPTSSGVPPPADFETSPADFNAVAQFAALRRLHAALKTHRDSPGVLGALSRGYANLGAETAFLWSPAHKVFEARALLYAERLVKLTSGSPEALWSRAYVRALVGRHQAALDDLKLAAMAAPDDGAKTDPPGWVEVIRAHCEFDQSKLVSAERDQQLGPLSRYLQMLAQEFTTGYQARLRTAGNVIEVSPDSFRAMDLLGADSPLGVAREARRQALELFPTSLYRRLLNVAGLPGEAVRLCDDERDNEDARDMQDEMQTRLKLTGILKQTARTAGDRAEPSLGILAALIEETGFVHAWRMADFMAYSLAVPADETIDLLRPLFEGHPYRKYIESLRRDRPASESILKQLAPAVDTAELELTEGRMLSALGNTGRGFFESTFYALAFFRFDPIYRDLTRLVLSRNNDYMPHHKAELKAASPHAPVIIAGDIASALNMKMPQLALEHAAEWEKNYGSDSTVLAALSKLYLAVERDDDVLRIAKREFEVSPELDPCLRLARLYEKRGDTEHWKATLEEFLKQDSLGLEQSTVQIEFANHYMALKEWDNALPYATEAAETWSSAGLMAAHRCYAGMKDWKRAELYIRRSAERYPQNGIEWFFWCRRTGKGDAEAAHRLTAAYYASLGDPPPPEIIPFLAAFKELSGELEAALHIWIDAFQKTSDPYNGLSAALLAYDLGQTDQRDKLLEQVVLHGHNYRVEFRAREELISFAAMFTEQKKAGRAAEFDEERFEKIINEAPIGEPTNLHYFAGKFLLCAGKAVEARRHLMLAATAPNLKITRTLAAALLLEQKVELEETREKE
jgi:tetratricopeptide (TPR) repeat protein